MPFPKVAIVGAGPAGLALAKILHEYNPSFPITLFERDGCPEARSQCGTLYLLGKDAQNAIKKAGIWEYFQEHARYPGGDLIIADRFGKIHAQLKDVNFGRPEVDRTALRHLLLDALPPNLIKWNARVVQAFLDPTSGKGTLYFADGTSARDFDLLVGAGGAWSKIRNHLVTPVSPFYAGICGFEAHISVATAKAHLNLNHFLGKRNHLAFGESEGNCLFCQRNPDGSIRIYLVGKRPERWLNTYGGAESFRVGLLADYRQWTPQQRALIELCDDHMIPRSLYMLPVGLRWPTRRGVTLLGDAAHLMTPFAGEGINAALTDAMMLAEAIQKSPDDVFSATTKYETWMFPFAREVTQRTWDDLQDCLEDGGCSKYREMIEVQMREIFQNEFVETS